MAGIDEPFSGLDAIVASTLVTTSLSEEERKSGIAGAGAWVPFAKGEGLGGEYWSAPRVAIDWSAASVAELVRRDKLPSGTTKKPRLQNRAHYFEPGLTYSVISSGRISVRLMPEGWIFGHKGSAIFAEPGTSELFLLGYLNSVLATYFMKKIVNSTATADIGYIQKLPYRSPSADLESAVIERVKRIIDELRVDPDADISGPRAEIDDLIFDLFEIHASRDEVRRFYENVGKAEATGEDVEAVEAQAASE